MSHPLPAAPARRRWPLAGRVPIHLDMPIAGMLIVAETIVYLWRMFIFGMEEWAQPDADTSALVRAGIDWTWDLMVAALIIAALAAVLRAPVVAVVQVLAAMVLMVLAGPLQHDYDRAHPQPAPAPSVQYTPCYSGSHDSACS